MKYLTLICCLIFEGSISEAWASDDDFNPPSPEEPSTVEFCKISVSADPEEAAYVSGSGRYKVGTSGSVYINASANNTRDYTYEFQYWTLNGVACSYDSWFYFEPQNGSYNFVAHYTKQEVEWDPTSPDEPSSSNVKRKYYLYLTQNLEGAGSFNIPSGNKYQEGTSIYLCAYANGYYQFEGWKVNGEIVCPYSDFYFTMPNRETTIEAVFSEIPFDPDSPSEPSNSEPGNVEVADPIRQYVTLQIGSSTNAKIDKTSILFNPNRSLDYEAGIDATKFFSTSAQYQIYSIDSNSVMYSVNQRPVDDGIVPLGIFVKNAGTASISASKLERAAKLYDKLLGIEHNLSQGAYSFTSEAGTFNDRFELHTPLDMLMGDVNNNNIISVSDLVMLIELIQGKTPTGALHINADIDNNGEIDNDDIPLLVNEILEIE